MDADPAASVGLVSIRWFVRVQPRDPAPSYYDLPTTNPTPIATKFARLLWHKKLVKQHRGLRFEGTAARLSTHSTDFRQFRRRTIRKVPVKIELLLIDIHAESMEVSQDCTVADALTQIGLEGDGIRVVVNGREVRPDTPLETGDIVTLVRGQRQSVPILPPPSR